MSTWQELIRDPAWQFAGVVMALFALFLAWAQRRTKRLAYTISTSELLSVDAAIRDVIEISYRGTIVPSVTLVEIEVANIGKVAILPSDFICPLAITLSADAILLTVHVVESRPEDLGVEFLAPTPASEGIRHPLAIQPLLLNRQDRFKLNCLVSKPGDVGVTGRIAGVTRIERRDIGRYSDERRYPRVIYAFVWVLATFFLVGGDVRKLWVVVVMLAFEAVRTTIHDFRRQARGPGA